MYVGLNAKIFGNLYLQVKGLSELVTSTFVIENLEGGCLAGDIG